VLAESSLKLTGAEREKGDHRRFGERKFRAAALSVFLNRSTAILRLEIL
jgi:hypothetical protein